MDNAGSVRYVITADNDAFLDQLVAAGKALTNFANNISDVDSQLDKFAGSSSTSSFTDSLSASVKQLGQFTSSLAKVGWNAFTTAAGTASATLMKFASGAVTDTQFLENTQIQMQGLTHSIEDGNRAMAYATQYFKNNPFNRFDVTDATKQLIQYGAALDDIPTLLDKMGKVSLSTGVEINTLSRIYQSAMSNGRISTGDINMLAERGIPIWKALGDVTGKTNAQIREDLQKGKLAIEDFQKAFDLLVDDNAMEQFNNTFSRQVDRFKGRLSNMRAAIAGYTMDMESGLVVDPNGLYRAVTEVLKVFANTFDYGVGKDFLESLTKLGNGLAWIIDKLMGFYEITIKTADGTEKVVKMSKTLDTFFSGLGKVIDTLTNNMELMLPVGIAALSMFGGLLSRVPIFGQVLQPVTTAVKGLTSAFSGLNPVLQIIVGVLGAGVFKAIQDGKLSEPLQRIWTSIKRIGEALAPVVKHLYEVAQQIGERVVVSGIEAIASILEVLANVLTSIPTETLTKIVEGILGFMAIRKVQEPLGNFITTLSQVKSVVTSFFHGGLEGSSILGQFKKVFGKDSELTEATQTISKTQTLANSTTEAASKLGKAANSTSQLREHLKNIALIAVDIAALGLAIGIASRAMPDDLLLTAEKFGLMVGAVIVMGALAKAAEKVKVSNKAIFTIVELAGDIAALGVALGLADRMIVSDFNTLTLKMAAMGIAIVGMGVLAKIAEQVKFNASGILIIAGLALDIAAVGAALGVADRMIQSDFGTLMTKLGAMGIAIAEMGVLAAAIGAVVDTGIGAIILGSGLVMILALAGALATIATALGIVDAKIPVDTTPIKKKIEGIYECIKVMVDNTWVNPFKSFFKSLDVSNLASVASFYVSIANDLNEISRITLNKAKIKTNVETITDCLRIISNDRGDTSVVQMFKTTVSQFLGAVDVDTLSKVVNTYYGIAETLNQLQNIYLNKAKISQTMMFIADTVHFLGSTTEGSVALALQKTATDFLASVDIDSIKKIVDIYKSIAETLSQIEEITLDKSAISKNVMFIAETIEFVTRTDEGSVFAHLKKALNDDTLRNSVESAKQIIDTYKEIGKSLNSLTWIKFEDSDMKNIATNINNYQKILAQVLSQNGDGGLAGLIRKLAYGGSITPEDVEKVRDILYKFIQLSDVISVFKSTSSNLKIDDDRIKHINEFIEKVANIRPITTIEYKVETILGAKSIFEALTEVSKEAEQLQDIGGEASETFQKLYHIRDFIAQVGMVWEAPDIDNKEYVIHMSQSILNAMSEMAVTATNLTDVNQETQDKVIRIRDLVAQIGMVWQADDIENKELVVNTSKSILETMKSFAEVANTIPAIEEGREEIISTIKTSIAKMVEIPSDDIQDRLTTVQSARAIIDELVGISQSMSGFVDVSESGGILKSLVELIKTEITGLVTSLTEFNGEFYQIGQNLAMNIVGGFNDYQLPTALFDKVTSAAIALEPFNGEFYTIGNNLAMNVSGGFADWRLPEEFKNIFNQTVAAMGIFNFDFYEIGNTLGRNLSQGFANGIDSEVYRVNKAIGNISDAAVNRLRQLLGIASPSKVMFELGAFVGEGLVEGLMSTEEMLSDVMETMAEDIENPLEEITSQALNLAGITGNGGVYSTRSSQLTMNNNIYTEFDIDQMGRDIMWNMERY